MDDGRERVAQAVELAVRGAGRYTDGRAPAFDVDLRIAGEVREPAAGELAITITATGRGADRDARVDIAAAGARLVAAVRTQDADQLALTLERLSVPGALVLAAAPGLPVRADVTVGARGTFSRSGDQAWISASASAGRGGRLDLHGKLDLARQRTGAEGLVVTGRHLDLSALLKNGPPSDLAFDLEARGGGRDAASLDGSVRLRVAESRIDGRPVGPLRLAVDVAPPGRVTLTELVARLPGVEVTAKGGLANGALDLRAVIDARRLADLAQSLAPPGGRPRVALAGRGHAEVSVVGTLARPSLRFDAAFPTLIAGANRVERLVARVVVPDLRRPEAADIDVRARAADVGGRELRDLAVLVRAAGAKVNVAASVAGPQPLTLSAAGKWRAPATRGARELQLDSFDLRYPEGAWSLARPAVVAFGSGRLSIRDVALASGEQRVVVDLARDERTLRGHVVMTRFDLGRLPRALIPAGTRLAGMVNAEARVKKGGAIPDMDASISLEGGRIAGYRGLALQLDVHVDGARARGHVDARGLGTALRGDFDLPASWPPRPGRAPLTLALELAETDLAMVMKAINEAMGEPVTGGGGAETAMADTGAPGRSPPVLPTLLGKARLSLAIRGSAADPRVELSAATRGLVVDQRPIGDVNLALSADGEKPLQLQADLVAAVAGAARAGGTAAPGRATVKIRAAQSLRALLALRPPQLAQLLRTRFEVKGDIDRLPLAGVALLAGYHPAVGGVLSLHADLTGTALSPRGTLSLDVAGATSGRFPPTDGRVVAVLGEHQTTARIEIDRNRKRLLEIDARLDASAARLTNVAALADAPLRLRATLHPLQLQRLGLPPQTDRDPARVLKGLVRAGLAVDGNLRAPVVDLTVDAADIRLDKVLVGEAHVAARYDAGQAKMDARLFSANRGSLRIEASTRAALGYPAVLRGLDVGRLPVTARVRAQGFDVQGFSGVTAGLRTVGGQLFAEAEVNGTVADPRLSGRLEWKDGAVAVTGFGEYRDIHLLLRGDQRHLVLDELRVGSGGGQARVTATADHVAGEGYRYTARAEVRRFPVYSQGQALATVSLDLSARGSATPLKVRSSLEIRESRVVLSDAKRRQIQTLKRPADVVLVDQGKPLNDAQAAKLLALVASSNARAAAARAAPPSSPPPSTMPPPPPAPPSDRDIRVRVEAPRNLWVTGKDATLELGLSSPFRISVEDRPLVFGEVKVLRGRIDLFGRRFDIKQPSTLRLSGPPDRPEVDVQARYTNETENVTVLVTAKGPVDHLQLAVSSPNRPELGESQLYTLIITGKLQLGGSGAGSSSPSAQAVSLMGGLIASKLQKALSSKLPLDVLTIDAGGAGLTGTQLEAGTYLTDKLYVGYVGRVGADPMRYQNRNAVHLEYQLTPRWSFDGEYGDVGTGSADLIWTKSY
ncbi:MAG: translocation/assembly module TamB domain-containing protein [Pseudomonadota bacterium]